MLRYESGQFYKVHHDQNSPRSSAWGPRMFTVFMYVGDGYEGGLTHFPRLNLTIPAGKGRACVWTSVLDSDPYQVVSRLPIGDTLAATTSAMNELTQSRPPSSTRARTGLGGPRR